MDQDATRPHALGRLITASAPAATLGFLANYCHAARQINPHRKRSLFSEGKTRRPDEGGEWAAVDCRSGPRPHALFSRRAGGDADALAGLPLPEGRAPAVRPGQKPISFS